MSSDASRCYVHIGKKPRKKQQMISKSSHIKHKINTTSYNIILPHPFTISTPHGDYNLSKETHQIVPKKTYNLTSITTTNTRSFTTNRRSITTNRKAPDKAP